jgi:threonyl-tRNA synthetase
MIHRALFGSIERFFGVLTEHYSGAFPPWLAPVQAIGIPVADAFSDYLAQVIKDMKRAGIRAELDASDDRMQKKVRNAQMQKIPFMVIAGEEDMAAGAVSFRYRNGEQKNGIPIADAIEEIKKCIIERTQV